MKNRPLTPKAMEEDRFELALREQLYLSVNEEGARLLLENDFLKNVPNYSSSEAGEEKMRGDLYRCDRKREAAARIKLIAYRACACLCCLFMLGTVLAFSIPPVRASLIELLIGINNAGQSATVNTNNGEYFDLTDIDCQRYIPEGYKVSSVSRYEDIKQIEYRNEQQRMLIFSQQKGKSLGTIDTENLDEWEKVVIGTYYGYYTRKEGNGTLLWSDEKNLYTIAGEQMSKIELLKTAGSVYQ